jgi:hypothetical protein
MAKKKLQGLEALEAVKAVEAVGPTPAAAVPGGKKGKKVAVMPSPAPAPEPEPANLSPVTEATEQTAAMDELAQTLLANWVAPESAGTVVSVYPERVDMSPQYNGRETDPKKVKEYCNNYAARIKEGLEPQLQECVGFYPRGEDDLRLVFGFHRGLAARLYNSQGEALGRAPMLLRVRVVDEPTPLQALVDNFTENQRNNPLSPVAEMHYFRRLKDEFGFDNKTVAQKLGVSAPLVSLRLSLHVLPASVLKLVESGDLPVKAAQALATMPDDKRRQAVIARAQEVFAGMGDAETLRRMKVPKLAIVEALIQESGANGENGANGANGAPGDGAGGEVTPPAPLLRKLSHSKMNAALAAAIQFPNTPTATRNVLRAMAAWITGEREIIPTLKAITKACGVDHKAISWEGVMVGALPPEQAQAQAPAPAQATTQPGAE